MTNSKQIFNSVTKLLPRHLHQFIVEQSYEKYTAQNQAVWRYVMWLNTDFLPKVAHSYYLKGIKETGISVHEIPKMEGMNRILKNIGWAAVSVDGFIPPNAFMEFQAYNVLVIASDIRVVNHIRYTPAPDILHEAAGHAPIIANPEYAEYLRRFGEIGSKAISSIKDFELYEAVRKVSILKEDPNTTKKELDDALIILQGVQDTMGELSEMAQIRNLHWWTVEYGLIGEIDNPKIYGAGLLSSIGESKLCLEKEVEKIPFTIRAATVNFDITKPQPQLFVTPDFAHLSSILEKFADNMAVRKGGLLGLEKLINSKNIGTVELSTGIQISGVFTKVISYDNKPIYIQTIGETALAFREKELIGHGTSYHSEGFGSPVGTLEGINLAIEDMSPRDLEIYGICEGEQVDLVFDGGIKVSGKIITGKRDLSGKIILISFEQCTVAYGETVLFKPEWGIYDMAIGKEVIAAFSGPASSESFENLYQVSVTKTHEIMYNDVELRLHTYYQEIREMRENESVDFQRLSEIIQKLKIEHSNDWLLPLEIYELVCTSKHQLAIVVKMYLEKLKSNMEHAGLITDGVALIHKQ